MKYSKLTLDCQNVKLDYRWSILYEKAIFRKSKFCIFAFILKVLFRILFCIFWVLKVGC